MVDGKCTELLPDEKTACNFQSKEEVQRKSNLEDHFKRIHGWTQLKLKEKFATYLNSTYSFLPILTFVLPFLMTPWSALKENGPLRRYLALADPDDPVELLVELICANSLPLSMVSSNGFRKFCLALNPG